MISQEQAFSILKEALSFLAQADEAEASLVVTSSFLTRFALNQIHQNVFHEDAVLQVRAALGKSVGTGGTNQLDAKEIQVCCQASLAGAEIAPPDEEFPGFARPSQLTASPPYDDETARLDPASSAGRVASFVRSLKGLPASGALHTLITTLAVATSLGQEIYGQGTRASFEAVVGEDIPTTWVGALSPRVVDLRPEELAKAALRKMELSRPVMTIEPGEYAVLLEPAAVATLISFLAFVGFSARAYQEGRSFLVQSLGKKIAPAAVTLVDDAYHPLTLGLPFDREGVPKKRVALIEKGVAVGMVHDLKTGAKAGLPSTGHASFWGSDYGPMPAHLVLTPGDSSLEEMIATADTALLITRFHYTNVVDYRQAIITGMTRDGTFLIKEGKILGAVKDLRFAQGILEALQGVQAIGNEAHAVSALGGAAVVPALKLSHFRFVSPG